MSIPATADKQMVANVFPNNWLRICGIVLTGMTLVGCAEVFSAAEILQSRPVQLDGEQVLMDLDQLDCGTREELWNITQLGGGRAVGSLTKKGRDLQFSDDVQIGDPAITLPYAQIHGSFPVRVMQDGETRDEDPLTKVYSAKVGVIIAHSCFQNKPPVLMGIRHGQFDPYVKAVFRLKLEADWLVAEVIH